MIHLISYHNRSFIIMKKIKKMLTVSTVTVIVGLLSFFSNNYVKIFNHIEIFKIKDPITLTEVNSIKVEKLPELPLQPTLLYRVSEKQTISAKDRECLLKNIFYEASGEPIEGKIAVAQITFNRLADGRWGNSICKVVYANKQFSWTLDARKRNTRPGGPAWEECRRALDQYLTGTRVTNLERGTHFHATWLNTVPAWAYQKQRLAQIGQHIFYASLN